MNKNITMRDIASALGVSAVTVSKALTDKDGVGPQLRQDIKQKAQEMGYRYHSLAKPVKEGKSYNLGVIIGAHFVDMDAYPYYIKMYQNIIMCLSKRNYSGIIELVVAEMLSSLIMPNVIAEKKVDGIIVLGQLPDNYLQKIRESGLPLIYMDFVDKNMEVESVSVDNMYSSYLLTNYVVSMGHKKIAYVGNIEATTSILDRYLGYYRSLLVNHLEPRSDYLISDRGEDGMFKELKLPADMPTAFVCNCDEIAYVLMDRLKAMGYAIPADISVVGFDNYTFAGYSSPKLTTVEVDMEAMSEAAVDSLLRKIESNISGFERKVISGKLIIRDSVKRL